MAGVLLVALVSLLVVVGPCHARPMPRSKAAQGTVANSITAIYNFGDSLSDTGNLLREGDATGVLQYTTGLPYGSAIGGATGRCSDGYLMIDYLAKDLGLPLLNPYLNKDADFTHGCLIGLNLFTQMHNVLLQEQIRELRAAYPAATIAYADYFYAYVQMLRDAGKTGFDKGSVMKACCGTGGGAYNVDMDRMCGEAGPDQYLSFDGVHLTQRAYRVITDLLYHKGFASPAPVEFTRA
ncbi:hypothetical protein PR202_ga01919 [Eleusine coracana subsp. coracana]|uniref:GDSL esterase/lipase n=1 Tax=Eleusine coracana subsp. coracana TaxID=191504 RepID=A0AAV5BGC2_ELECO|nr:hypothetical protein PR202_ga01232 [Eleusine coracana subsp. coracana]GJM86097.1 hypothetical protein PR202_ga01919 [Eleusine coracana subsp. coracana]